MAVHSLRIVLRASESTPAPRDLSSQLLMGRDWDYGCACPHPLDVKHSPAATSQVVKHVSGGSGGEADSRRRGPFHAERRPGPHLGPFHPAWISDQVWLH